MNRLGEVLPNGQILLYDENIKYRDAMTGHYRRVRMSPRQVQFLADKGYKQIISSFISGAMVDGDDLFIRFHNASVYKYYGFGFIFDDLLKANSKGQFFNRRIRPTKRYTKEDSLPFPSETQRPIELSDEEMFAAMDMEYLKTIARGVPGAVIMSREFEKDGIKYVQYKIGDLIFYRPIKSIN